MLRLIILKTIRLYQKTFSLDHGLAKFVFGGGRCRFRPTCSQYFYSAITKYGILKGGWLGLKRISRCHPLHPGGWDPLK